MTYTKTHDPWAVTDPLTAAAMNNLESQWTQMKALVDVHNHDTRYYTKAIADTTFFSTSYFTGFNADLLDGTQLIALTGTILPIGSIMLWSGSDATVPSGWYVCDGNAHNGYTTPNLIERFVIGAGGSYAVNATGGPASWNGTITPTGSVAIGAHTLTTAEIPIHLHAYSEYTNDSATRNGTAPPSGTLTWLESDFMSITINNQDEGGGGSHGHTGSSASFSTVDPRPAYHSLYYIMKCE